MVTFTTTLLLLLHYDYMTTMILDQASNVTRWGGALGQRGFPHRHRVLCWSRDRSTLRYLYQCCAGVS